MEANELDTDMEVADSKVVGKEHVDSGDESSHQEQPEAENATSYELITGLLHPGDWPEESYNVRRCTGLEVRKALLLWCRDAVYVIDGLPVLGHRELRFPRNRRWSAERPGRRNSGPMGSAAALPAGVHGSDGQVGPVPPPRLAARCHGGPNADFSADSRRNDGGRRGVPGGPP